MKFKVTFRPQAEADLFELYRYIAERAGHIIAGRYIIGLRPPVWLWQLRRRGARVATTFIRGCGPSALSVGQQLHSESLAARLSSSGSSMVAAISSVSCLALVTIECVDRFVEDVLRAKARRRERWIVGLPAAGLALAGLVLLARVRRKHAGGKNAGQPAQ